MKKVEVVEFKDVPKGHWSEEAIHYLAKEKYFQGIWKWTIWIWGSYYSWTSCVFSTKVFEIRK